MTEGGRHEEPETSDSETESVPNRGTHSQRDSQLAEEPASSGEGESPEAEVADPVVSLEFWAIAALAFISIIMMLLLMGHEIYQIFTASEARRGVAIGNLGSLSIALAANVGMAGWVNSKD